MTAFIALKYADRVELLADGAIYVEEGTLIDIRSKIVVGKCIAVTSRGNAEAGRAFAQVVAMMSDTVGFDAAMDWLSDALSKRVGTIPEFGFELVVTGISESRGPVILYATTNAYCDGVSAWTLIDADAELAGGNPVQVDSADFTDSLIPAGIAAMDAMRQVPGINPVKPDLPAVYGIGGHVDHAVVRAAGVTVQRVHVWPEDVVGQKIEPRLAA